MATKKELVRKNRAGYAVAALRILIGVIVIWAFMDKTFGLGRSTCLTVDPKTKVETVQVICDKAWIKGGSPTTGFLKYATKGPMSSFYSSLAGNKAVDLVFMVGLFGIGLALVLGIGIKIATVAGSVLFLMMWSAVLPPANHPFLDEHLVYVAALMAVLFTNKDQKFGLGSRWRETALVRSLPILE